MPHIFGTQPFDAVNRGDAILIAVRAGKRITANFILYF